MYDKLVTIFNYYESATTGDAYWYPHVLSNVDLNTDRGAIIKKYGPDTADNVQLHVKYAVVDSDKSISADVDNKPSDDGTVLRTEPLIDTKGDAILDVAGNNILVDSWIHNSQLKWLPPKEWKKQTNDMLADTITFSPEDDFFWEGEWDKGIVTDDNYRGGFYQYMNQSKDNVFKITSVGGPYSLIPHFEILAK